MSGCLGWTGLTAEASRSEIIEQYRKLLGLIEGVPLPHRGDSAIGVNICQKLSNHVLERYAA